jgi:glutathione S-transferase
MMNPVPYTLYTFAMSHYSEKIRWTLDASGIAYREVCLAPVFHILPALTMGRRGQTTLPVLKTPQGSIQDSPRILRWLREHHGPMGLMPEAQLPEIEDVAQRFDAIGKDVARYLYAHSFGSGDEHIKRLWTDHATPAQAVFIRRAYPVIEWAFRRKLNITAAGAARAHQRIGEAVDWLDARLADGRTCLVGGQLTTADLTAASLLAPLACPSEHPVYGEPVFRQTMAGTATTWQLRPSMAWVRQMYAQHRGAMHGGVALSPKAA